MRYCKDCKWLCGKQTEINGSKHKIGIECMNKNRRLVRHGKYGLSRIKQLWSKACKTGFEPKEVDNE